jgi:tetraacyldisaccharide 4'-kinase
MRLKSHIETLMNDSKKDRIFSLGYLLSVVSIGYDLVVRLRATGYRKHVFQTRKLPCYVISIGNLTTGGTGKTPVTVYVAEFLKGLGYRTAIISRGYKGKAEKKGGVVHDGHRFLLDPDQAGDEPWMMAKRLKTVPIIVNANRIAAGLLAIEQFDPEVILLDDAFQHLKLFRDLDLVLLDRHRPFGNGCLLPRGSLRERVDALVRGDAVVFTRSDITKSPSANATDAKFDHMPVFECAHVPYVAEIVDTDGNRQEPGNLQGYQGKRVFAFSGIAKNHDFFQTLRAFKCHIVGSAGFADHHRYTDKDLVFIARSALNRSAEVILTTEKDHARMQAGRNWPIPLVVVGINIHFKDDAFDRFILGRLEQIKDQQI